MRMHQSTNKSYRELIISELIKMLVFPVMLCRLHAAAALLYLLVVLVGGPMARSQAIPVPTSCCSMFQGLDMTPCLQDAVGGAVAGGNISGACCSSLNQALDAGHRFLCSLLLPSSGGVRVLAAGLAAALPALPLALPLPGCLLYAPPLAYCQVPVQEQTDAPPAATEEATASTAIADSPPPQAVVMPSAERSKKRSVDGKKADQVMNGSDGNGDGKAKERASHSDAAAARASTDIGQGIRAYLMSFVVAMAAFWLN
uniref:Bifunctional inhibitor/plant lipid transfer protein/seed storage helical domain-containing protein n=1 Tax=Leersia perrieri TaxID=77586 RepID=A0A0D9WQC3_9ORYZ